MNKIYLLCLAVFIGLATTACTPKEKVNEVIKEVPHAQNGNGSQSDPDSTGVGNGGGAIVHNGNVLTLAQAGVEIPVTEKVDVADVQEVHFLSDVISRMALTDGLKGRLLRAVLPSDKRRYFDIKEEDLNPVKRQKLLAAYESEIGQSIPNDGTFVLVAVTIGTETFLLPEFYQLSDSIARAAILFHEALWVQNAKMSLKAVLSSEIAMEKFFRTSGVNDKLIYNHDLFFILSKAFDDPTIMLTGAVKKDFQNGSIGVVYPLENGATKIVRHNHPSFTIRELLGDGASRELQFSPAVNRDFLKDYYYQMSKLNPGLLFVDELKNSSENIEIFSKWEGVVFRSLDSEIDLTVSRQFTMRIEDYVHEYFPEYNPGRFDYKKDKYGYSIFYAFYNGEDFIYLTIGK